MRSAMRRRDVELGLDLLEAVADRGLGLGFLRQCHRRCHARAQRHGHEVAGREFKPFRHPIGVRLVEGDRDQDIDDAFGHDQSADSKRLRNGEGRGEIYSAVSSATPTAGLAFAANDVAGELMRWLAYLCAERRMSPKTVDAYERDVRQFLTFLCDHLDSRVTLSALSRLKPLDVRAFMAARRARGTSSRSPMRMLAGVRSFARFLESHGNGKVGALSPVRTP